MNGPEPREYLETKTIIDIDRNGLKAQAEAVINSKPMFTNQSKTTKFA